VLFYFWLARSVKNPHKENLSIFGRIIPPWAFAEKLQSKELSSILENISQRVHTSVPSGR
jgi:hypothetical protein